jgi:hypothetical protein
MIDTARTGRLAAHQREPEEVSRYARSSCVRVAPTESTTPWRKGVGGATTRWTRAETRARIASARPLRWPSPDGDRLERLIAGYERITGEHVNRPRHRSAQVNLIAVCYRVHGDAFLEVLADWYLATGTTVNLLGQVRCAPPAESIAPRSPSAVMPKDDRPSETAPIPGRQPSADLGPLVLFDAETLAPPTESPTGRA